jgi:hypothetical protein
MPVPSSSSGPPRPDAHLRRQGRWLRVAAMLVLIPVAVIGAALSFRSLYLAAVPVFGPRLALGFPLLVDFLILGASLQYVAGAKTGRPRAGWRWTAHAGVAGTLFLNAMAAHSLAEVPWHVTAPAVWSVLVELSAREVLGQWRAIHAPTGERIPLRLWLTAPIESCRTWLRIARRVEGEQAAARLDVGVHAAAVEALKLSLPQRRARRVRRILKRQLRAGSLPPSAILGPLGWLDSEEALTDITPHSVLRAALRDTLHDHAPYGHQRHEDRPVVLRAEPPPARELTAAPGPVAAVAPGSDPDPAAEPGPVAVADPVAAPGPVAEPDPDAVPSADPGSVPSPATSDQTLTRTAPTRQTRQERQARQIREAVEDAVEVVEASEQISTGDRFADAVEIVRVHESITAPQLATQLRSLGWQLSDRTAGRILSEVRAHLVHLDPWALPMP